MLNTFTYAANIPDEIRSRLEEREALCKSAVLETSPLNWSMHSGNGGQRGRHLYQLTMQGMTAVVLAKFTEAEVAGLPDEEFKRKVFLHSTGGRRIPERTHVQRRVEEWITRLRRLYAQVKGWTPAGYKVLESDVLQVPEEFLQRVGLNPANVPVLTLLRGTQRIAFVPSALWIIGADGRVNISTNQRQYILIDSRSRFGLPSDWRIVWDDRTGAVSFDEEIFEQLLRRRT